MSTYTNRLATETSPYLLQHAHNPVDWYPWGQEALDKAVREDKPILVSIGYSACHWCHVMEKESFENEETAMMMNDLFVNIKIDREERPDLDHIYMDAVQAMTGSGGWPLNVFLTPDRKPFYGGTYYPPVRAFNRSSWKETLQGIANAFRERRQEINDQAESMTDHLKVSNGFGLQTGTPDLQETLFAKTRLDEIFNNLMKVADTEWGGFGQAPKFPQTFIIQFLLRYHLLTKNREALQQALVSIDKMIEGGIYDHLAGGFARYSTDREWLAPHFEKMLYDNALIINILSEAYQLTGMEKYKEVIVQTLAFIGRDMQHAQHGFYAAFDADSEGEEGKFYVWDYQEVDRLLGADAALFCQYYNIKKEGNWEGKNILHVKEVPDNFAKAHGFTPDEFQFFLDKNRHILLNERNKRIWPSLDDKILLGWNALMNAAYSKAFAATGIESCRTVAVKNMEFLLANFTIGNEGELNHGWKNGEAKHPAFLDDYACLINALIHLYEITADTNWLGQAKKFTEYVIRNFSEEETGFFYFTQKDQTDVIIRKKEVYDGAVPSGNSIMAHNLFRLAILLGEQKWTDHSQKMLVSLGKVIVNYPSSFGMWTCFLQETIYSTNEIVILGEDFMKQLLQVLSAYIPHKVVMASKESDFYYPLLTGKGQPGSTLIYLCKEFSCRQPVNNVQALLKQL